MLLGHERLGREREPGGTRSQQPLAKENPCQGEGAPNAKAQAPPNAKAQDPKPMPVSMRKHTGTHTCDVWSKGTGDGGLEETLTNKTIEPPEPAPLRHCQWQKKVNCNNPH